MFIKQKSYRYLLERIPPRPDTGAIKYVLCTYFLHNLVYMSLGEANAQDFVLYIYFLYIYIMPNTFTPEGSGTSCIITSGGGDGRAGGQPPPHFRSRGGIAPPLFGYCDVTHRLYTDVGNRTRHYIYTDEASLCTCIRVGRNTSGATLGHAIRSLDL